MAMVVKGPEYDALTVKSMAVKESLHDVLTSKITKLQTKGPALQAFKRKMLNCRQTDQNGITAPGSFIDVTDGTVFW